MSESKLTDINIPNKKRERIFGILLFLNDVIFLGLAFYLSYVFKFKINNLEFLGPNVRYYVYYSVIGGVIMLVFFYFRRLYSFKNLYRGMGENQGVVLGVVASIFLVIIFNYYFNRDSYQLSRLWIVYIALLPAIFVMVSRFFAKKIIFRILSRMNIITNLLIIGINEEGKRIARTLSKNKIEKINVIGFIDDSEKSYKALTGAEEDGQNLLKTLDENNRVDLEEFKILGSMENVESIIRQNKINRIIISSKHMAYFDVLDLMDKVKDLNIEVQMSPSLFEFSVSRMKMFEAMGIPLIQIQKAGIRGIDIFYKWLIDYGIGIVIFALFLLILPFIALVIKLDSKGPVFYRQERYGKDFRKIRIFKFRTMRTGADKEKEIIASLYNREEGFKIKEDPRITRFGKFLRKTSLDEIPQIINVIKADLSIVGPRALAIQEGDMLEEWEKKRMQVNQGITGLWQVSGRSDISYEERMKLDLYYIQNWSIQLEIRIILLTFLKFFPDRSAY